MQFNMLSRREREVLDILYARGQASASEVRELLTKAPSYSGVRALLEVLRGKGYVRSIKSGARYVYLPIEPLDSAAESALSQVVQTFFGGSVEKVVATLVSTSESQLSEEQLARLAELIAQAREEGR